MVVSGGDFVCLQPTGLGAFVQIRKYFLCAVPLSQAKLKLYPEQMDQFRLLGHAMKTKLAAILKEQRRLSLFLSQHIRGHACASLRQQMAGGMQVRCTVENWNLIWVDKGSAPEYVAVLRLCKPA